MLVSLPYRCKIRLIGFSAGPGLLTSKKSFIKIDKPNGLTMD